MKRKKRKRKIDLSNFQIETRYIQDTHEEEVKRFRRLIQLIFPHFFSASDQRLDNLSEKSERDDKA